MSIRVLVACEYSGVVRDAFLRRGARAVSCDLLPSESDFGEHYQGDVLDVIDDGWDMMIAHPPCTYLSCAGNAWLSSSGRQEKRAAAFSFFMQLAEADIDKICVENPVGYPNLHWRKPDQIIHPYYFGDCQLKRTCLWLKNLPCLVPTMLMVRPQPISFTPSSNHARYFTDSCLGKDRAKLRAKFFVGVAEAMAEQWLQEGSITMQMVDNT
ncbi:MAG TPA: DNA cytosine methyltransferase [Methanocorpusculum sp.]|nr:DNA cytosine methyltransferase [Methanocorpusculum sp.]